MKKRSFWLALIVLTLIFTACTDSNSLTSEADGDGAPNGDEDISDGDDDDIEDGDSADGDGALTDGDSDCANFSGHYIGELNCEAPEQVEADVSIDTGDCTFEIDLDGESWVGAVDGNSLAITLGRQCNGTVLDGPAISMACNDGCSLWLVAEGESDSDAGIAVERAELQFGAVAIGEAVQQDLKITSTGSGPLHILDATLSPDTPAEFSVIQQPDPTVEPGESTHVVVQLAPTQEAEFAGWLLIRSNADNSPTVRVRLIGGHTPHARIDLDPTAVDFGSISTAGPSEKILSIVNQGGGTATITSVQLEDDADGIFRILRIGEEGGEQSPSFEIEGGHAVPVLLQAELTEGAFTIGERYIGRLTVHSSDFMRDEYSVSADLLLMARDVSDACLEITPLDGRSGFGGIGVYPGPGADFGYTAVGTSVQREFMLKNSGDRPLTISSIAWQPAGLDTPYAIPRPFAEAPGAFRAYTLERGQSVYLPITFSPPQSGTFYASAFYMDVDTSCYTWQGDPPLETEPWVYRYAVGVSGTGADRGIEVLPSGIGFGNVTIGCCSRPEDVTVYNTGELPLEISAVEIGVESDTSFEVRNLPSLPLYLGGNGNPQSFSFNVRFCPESEQQVAGSVKINSDDDENGLFTLPLSGEGIPATHQTDIFRTASAPKIDILFVVDCSGSMDEEQEKLADTADYFSSLATERSADFHLGVISCDITPENPNRGKLQGDPIFLDSESMSSTEIIDGFRDRITNVQGCEGDESGLEATYLALSEPLISEANAGFLREDAKLAIFWISDEEDQSNRDISFYIDFFRSIKGTRNTNMLEAYAIVGDEPQGCSWEGGEAGAGRRYIQVADACNVHDDAHFISICEPDYHPVLGNLCENLYAIQNQFYLSRLADPDTIVVTVNDMTVTNWNYDEMSNSIIFPYDFLLPGSDIAVQYDTLCLY